jgi:exopolyphosphatase/guanosine-5'-triphosphate,3'-diphosphate pyrophosphatase
VRALELFQRSSFYYSAAGVRDGIIADLTARGVGRQLSLLSREQRKIVEQMTKRYGVAMPHARKVASLGHSLFESLQPLHKLPPHYGKLLEAAGYLHDIGHFVSDSSHHKHSYYLVAHADMPGFTDSERQVIAALCRYHRKTPPTLQQPVIQALNPEGQRAVTMLTPLLRVADSLDRSHEQRVENMRVDLKNGSVVVTLESEVDTDLEIWAVERNAGAFRQVYQLPLVLAKAKT